MVAPASLPSVSGATVVAVPVRAPAAFKNALQVATGNFQVNSRLIKLSRALLGSASSALLCRGGA